MRCTICCAVLGLLVSNGAVFPQPHVAARPGPRPRVKVIGVRWFAPPPPVFVPYAYIPVPIPYSLPDPIPYSAPDFVPASPTLAFAGSASPSHPQLLFNDGTMYTVTDYWRVNDQLHFITIEESGTKSVPHAVPFGNLNVQRTTEANAAQGFRFMVRDEPIEQWLEHHRQRARRRSDTGLVQPPRS
jgi:hypothetical protein